MFLRIRDGRVDDVRLRIYEPPRFFEAFLRGRGYREPVDITARICGICPIAYQMSACAAIEDACGVEVARRDPRAAPAHLLRRVDREPRAARVHAPRAGLPRLRQRDRDGARPPRHRRAGADDQEGRQRDPPRGRRPRDPPGQRARRRLLPRAAPARAARAGRAARARTRRSRSRRCASPAASRCPTSSPSTSTSRSRRPDAYPLEGGRLVSTGGPRHRPGRVRGALRGAARGALDRAALASARARRLPRAARSRATR